MADSNGGCDTGVLGCGVVGCVAQRQWLAANTTPKGRSSCCCMSVCLLFFLWNFGPRSSFEEACTAFDNTTDTGARSIADNVTLEDANECCHGSVLYYGECICEEGYEGEAA